MSNEEWASMTECERSGIMGNCGLDCRVYLEGDCPEIPEIDFDSPSTTNNNPVTDYDRAMDILK